MQLSYFHANSEGQGSWGSCKGSFWGANMACAIWLPATLEKTQIQQLDKTGRGRQVIGYRVHGAETWEWTPRVEDVLYFLMNGVCTRTYNLQET